MGKTGSMNRRSFLGAATTLTVGGGLLLNGCTGKGDSSDGSKAGATPLKQLDGTYIPDLSDKAIDGPVIKAGVVGCGGRGSGAAFDFLNSGDNLVIAALADVFPDRLNSLRDRLKNEKGIEVPDDKCFIGFDAYKQLIDSDLDMVLLTTPPAFRPIHFKYAVEKGKHAFMEKPILVDPTGYRTIIAASKQADVKKLNVIVGTQRRHQRCYVEAFKKVKEGMIGEITGGNVYWNGGMLWYVDRKPEFSDMEWMIRDWVNWEWLSGDHIVEQHVHNLDVFNWFSGKKVVRATGFGDRVHRVTGDQFDFFSVDFEYEGGIHMHSMCRQIDGCSNNVSEFIQGSKGSWNSGDNTIRDLEGKELWKFDGEAEGKEHTQTNAYVLEHVDMVNHIRSNKSVNQAEAAAYSCLCAVLGRESAYTGKTITWDEISSSTMNMMPENPKIGPMDMTGYVVHKPGTGK